MGYKRLFDADAEVIEWIPRNSKRKLQVIQQIASIYARGLQQGYDDAVWDFHSATLPNGEYDESWMAHEPRLRRRLGALKRWYGVKFLGR